MPRMLKTAVFLAALLATVGAFAQSGIERLVPPLREAPVRTGADEDPCRDFEGYAAAHPGARLAVRTAERRELFRADDPVHLLALRHRTAQGLIDEARAAGGQLSAAEAALRARAMSPERMLARLGERLGYGRGALIRVEWSVRYGLRAWCRARRQGREPSVSEALAGSLAASLCVASGDRIWSPLPGSCPLVDAANGTVVALRTANGRLPVAPTNPDGGTAGPAYARSGRTSPGQVPVPAHDARRSAGPAPAHAPPADEPSEPPAAAPCLTNQTFAPCEVEGE